MPLIKRLAHVCIKTRNLEKTSQFYCDALGMRKVFDFVRQGVVVGAYYEASDHTFIEVFEEKHVPVPALNQNPNHFCLETDDLEAVRKVLVEKGYAPREILMAGDNTLQFWVKDPNGIDMEFHQYTDRSSQFNGQSVEVTWW